MSDRELLTADELAERLSVAPRTVQTWTRCGRIPVIRLTPKVLRYDWLSVLAALRDTPTAKGVASCD